MRLTIKDHHRSSFFVLSGVLINQLLEQTSQMSKLLTCSLLVELIVQEPQTGNKEIKEERLFNVQLIVFTCMIFKHLLSSKVTKKILTRTFMRNSSDTCVRPIPMRRPAIKERKPKDVE